MENYQQIDIKISPKLVPGRLLSKSICPCGMDAFKADVPLGKEYQCEVNSVRWARWRCDGCGKVSEVRLIDVYSDMPYVPIQWFLLDCLDLGAGFPLMPKPIRWETVENGEVAPKIRGPHVRKFN